MKSPEYLLAILVGWEVDLPACQLRPIKCSMLPEDIPLTLQIVCKFMCMNYQSTKLYDEIGVAVVKELERAAIERLVLLWLLQPAYQIIFGQHAEHTVGPNVFITVW